MPRKSKRKSKIKKEEPGIIEHKGFTVGQKIWSKYLTGKIISGVITRFILAEGQEEAIEIITEDMGYRTVRLSESSENRIIKRRNKGFQL